MNLCISLLLLLLAAFDVQARAFTGYPDASGLESFGEPEGSGEPDNSTEPEKPTPCERYKTDRKYTNVEFYGRLNCSTKATWCAMIYYMEHDELSANEDEQVIPVRCTRNHILKHHAYVQYNRGDGDDDQFYEPRIEILHDCNDGGHSQYEVDLELVDVNYNADYQEYEIDVAGKGVTTKLRRHSDFRYRDWIGQDTKEAKAFMIGPKHWVEFLSGTPIHEFPGIFEPYDEDTKYC